MSTLSLDQRVNKIFAIYILGFIFAFHLSIPVYVNSSFLASFISENFVGLVYSASSLLTILAFIFLPIVLERFGNYKTAFTLLLLELAATVGLAISHNKFLVIPLFCFSFVAVALLSFNLDVFLESLSKANRAGKVHGYFLMSQSIAWIMAQLLVSFILLSSNYSLLYFTSAALILPLLFVLSKSLRGFKDVRYQKIPFKETVATVHHDKNVSLAFVVGFLLQFFFAWMVIYTPIYLHNHIGFSWPELGLMFGLVLIPFVITEEPLGQLADTHLGEKEIMTIGFLIAAIFTTLVSFTDSNNFWVWTGILFMTRIGASMVEIMCETYFFKKVSASKIHILSLFRTLRPIAYLISPLIATLLFTVMDIKYLFAVLGILMLYGVHFSMSLEDTR